MSQLDDTETPLVLLGHVDWIWSVAFLPDGKQVISGSSDSSTRAWRVEDGVGVGTVMTQGDGVLAVAASGDGKWIATGGRAKTITIWNATTHQKVVESKGHLDRVWSLAFSQDSARVASGLHDGTVAVWSTTTGERLAGPFEGHDHLVGRIAFSPSGNENIASCDTSNVRIWHSHTGDLIIPAIQVNAYSLAWTPDGERLIVGCGDGSIKLFDTSTGSLVTAWKGHTTVVCSIAVSCNGEFLASGSRDKTVCLWETATQQQIGAALEHDRDVNSVAISPDGHHLASGGIDTKLRLWNLTDIIPKSPSLKNVASSETSSLCNFLDRPAVPPTRGAATDQLYPNFFDNDSHDVRDIPFHSRSHTLVEAPPPVDKPPKKRLSKFLNKFTPKKKDRGAETQSRQEREQAIVGAEPKHAIDPQPAATPEDLTEKHKEKPKESTVDNTDRSSTPTAKAQSADSGHGTKQRAHSQVKRIRQAMIRRERQEHAYVAEYRDRAIFACETGPLPDEIERGCCFHLSSYICFGQRDPNINPRENNAQSITRLSQSGHGMAQTNSRSLRARLDRLLVGLHVRKRPPASATASLSATIQLITSPHGGHNGLEASAPVPIPLSNQSPAVTAITAMDVTEMLVHPSTFPASASQTPSPPPQASMSSSSVDLNVDADSVPSDIEPNPWATHRY